MGGAERRFGRVPLRERRLARVSLAFVLHPGRLHHEQLRRLVPDHHLGDHVLDELILADRLPEGLSFARIFDRALQTGPDDTTGPCRDREPALIEPVHRDLEALALLADQVPCRHLAIPEKELARLAGPTTELFLRVA